MGEHATQIQELMQENDPASLRNAYRKLFKGIYLSDKNPYEKSKLTFALNTGLIFEEIDDGSGRTGRKNSVAMTELLAGAGFAPRSG